MAFNFSILKEIDFTNNENLVFLGILSVLVVIAISIISIIIRKIIRAIRKLIIRIFNIEVRKPQFNQKTSEWLHKSKKLEDMSTERKNAPKPELEFIGNFNAGEKKQEAKDVEKKFDEKEAEDIAAGLNKLKGIDSSSSEESKGAIQKINLGSTIKIPTPKRFQAQENSSAPQDLSDQKKQIDESGKPIVQKSANNFSKVTIASIHGSTEAPKTPEVPKKNAPAPQAKFDKSGSFLKSSVLQKGGDPFRKPDFVEDKLGPHSARRNGAVAIKDRQPQEIGSEKMSLAPDIDNSIFRGKSEVSREKLGHELEDDPNVWKASRRAGLTMNKIERAGLVKKIFSPVYGRNISRTDLKQGLKKLNEKLIDTKDMAEHAKIRKEIKFFKKIGGIK